MGRRPAPNQRKLKDECILIFIHLLEHLGFDVLITMRSVCFEVAMIAVALPVAVALDNGLVRVPWMGFSAWEVFRDTTPQQDPHHSLSESLIRETADAMVEGGFAEAGYTIVWYVKGAATLIQARQSLVNLTLT